MALVREVLASPLPADEAMAALRRFGTPRNGLVLNTQQARAPQLEALLAAESFSSCQVVALLLMSACIRDASVIRRHGQNHGRFVRGNRPGDDVGNRKPACPAYPVAFKSVLCLYGRSCERR